MIRPSRISDIKKAQKEAAIFRIISVMVHEATLEVPALAGLFVNRVELSPGKSVVHVYLYTAQGKAAFTEQLPALTLYKPSMRKALATQLSARYAADIVFRFDEQLDKTLHVEKLLTQVSHDDTQYAASEEDHDTSESL